jgi:hypothetical protein
MDPGGLGWNAIETAGVTGGGGFCTLVGTPPHPAMTSIIAAEKSDRTQLLIATNSLLETPL